MQAKGCTKETIAHYGAVDKGFPEFNVGDTIIVRQRVQEGDKERLQDFQGDVIAIRKNGVSSMFTVRKIGAHNIPVERIFPFHSPMIKEIIVNRRGQVRRAKLYYIRHRLGKSARVKEKIITAQQLAQIVTTEE
jgi:large subunit ribosomal protein L19